MSAITQVPRFVMVFVDGGYLRKLIVEQKRNITDIHYDTFIDKLIGEISKKDWRIRGELVRVFYYDANVAAEEDPQKYKECDNEFEVLRKYDYFQIRLGRLIKTGDGSFRQKGVDTLVAIDMITKAYDRQYDIAILLAGDDDFVDVVNAVKNKGLRVYGAFEASSASKRLQEAFDVRIPLESIAITFKA